VLANDEVESISVLLPEKPQARGFIELRGAGRRILLPETWPLPAVARDLGGTLVPAMVARAAERIERGETVDYRVPLRLLAWPLIGALLCASMLAIAAAQVARRWGTKDAVEPRAGIFVFLLLTGLVSAVGILRKRWQGGVAVSKSGLRPPGRDFGDETPWSAVTRAGVRSGVFELVSELPPATYRLPMDAPNAVVLAALAGRLRPS
jgi:hypothetical protein